MTVKMQAGSMRVPELDRDLLLMALEDATYRFMRVAKEAGYSRTVIAAVIEQDLSLINRCRLGMSAEPDRRTA